jgi:hypothetical protein
MPTTKQIRELIDDVRADIEQLPEPEPEPGPMTHRDEWRLFVDCVRGSSLTASAARYDRTRGRWVINNASRMDAYTLDRGAALLAVLDDPEAQPWALVTLEEIAQAREALNNAQARALLTFGARGIVNPSPEIARWVSLNTWHAIEYLGMPREQVHAWDTALRRVGLALFHWYEQTADDLISPALPYDARVRALCVWVDDVYEAWADVAWDTVKE